MTPSADLPQIDGDTFRRVLGHYPTGVCVVTAVDSDGAHAAMVIGSFTSVSLDPPLVAFLPNRTSTTWPRIEAAGRFCVNVLGHRQRPLCEGISRRNVDALTAHGHTMSPGGMPILEGVLAWIDCSLHAVHEAGDHYIAIGRVEQLSADSAALPLVFHRGRYGTIAELSHA